MYKVRAEIKGEFVIVKNFKNFNDMINYINKLQDSGLYDSIEFWEI